VSGYEVGRYGGVYSVTRELAGPPWWRPFSRRRWLRERWREERLIAAAALGRAARGVTEEPLFEVPGEHRHHFRPRVAYRGGYGFIEGYDDCECGLSWVRAVTDPAVNAAAWYLRDRPWWA
jgi:hypothetical protein